MAKTDKYIPVTEETFSDLDDLKSAGQSYDELVRELIAAHQQANLRRMLKETDDDELVPLDDL